MVNKLTLFQCRLFFGGVFFGNAFFTFPFPDVDATADVDGSCDVVASANVDASMVADFDAPVFFVFAIVNNFVFQ